MLQHKIGKLLTTCALISILCVGILFGGYRPAESQAGILPFWFRNAQTPAFDDACAEIPLEDLWDIITSNPDVAADWATHQTDCYAWDVFLAVNLPSLGKDSSEPDFDQDFGEAPVVWEGWKESSEVYLPGGAAPTAWRTPRDVPQQVIEQAEAKGLDLSQPFHNIGLIQQASGLVFKSSEDNNNEPIRYDIAMDESTFDYINTGNPYEETLYNLNGQENFAARCAAEEVPEDWSDCLQFNWDAMEVKGSWLWLDGNPDADEIKDRYIVANGYYQKFEDNGEPVIFEEEPVYEVSEVALTGFHISSKALHPWVWTTFENVYNADYTPTTVENPIPYDAIAANDLFQTRDPVLGTKYANYQLIGTQIDFTDPVETDALLANSQIETHFQKSSSCITCHAIGAISTQPTGPFRLSFVDSRDGNLTYYVGELTDVIQEELQTNFMQMDYVWSMRLAQRYRGD